MNPRTPGAVLAALYLLLIALLTLTPSAYSPGDAERAFCLLCGPMGGVDFALNLAFFVPLGFLLRLAGLSRGRALALCIATTLAIELIQLAIPGRVTSLGDLVSNSIGGAVGIVVADRWPSIITPEVRQARAWTAAWSVGLIAVLVGTMWLFEPSLPQTAWWGQIAAELGQFDHFQGRVLDARVGPLEIREGRLPNGDSVRALLGRRGTVVRASVVPAPPSQRLAPIVSIFDGDHREIMVLGEEGAAAIFRVRRRATAAGLQPVSVNFWYALPYANELGRMRDTIVLEAWNDGWSQHIARIDHGTRTVRTLTLRPTWGWALLAPFENSYGPAGRSMTRQWLALLLFPLGFHGALAMRRAPGERRWRAAIALPAGVAALLAVALEALPRAYGVGGSRAWEWEGALAGLALGALAALPVAWAARRNGRAENTDSREGPALAYDQ
jgi:hypothetical protein